MHFYLYILRCRLRGYEKTLESMNESIDVHFVLKNSDASA